MLLHLTVLRLQRGNLQLRTTRSNALILVLLCPGLVSGKARRYKQGGYDLDLAYITDHVIAMSYPFEGRRGTCSAKIQ